MADSFAGIPTKANAYVPKGEAWLVKDGKAEIVLVDECPKIGQDVESFLSDRIVRIFNIPPLKWPKIEFKVKL